MLLFHDAGRASCVGATGVGAAWTVGKEAAIAAAMVAIVGGRDGVREKDCADFAFSQRKFPSTASVSRSATARGPRLQWSGFIPSYHHHPQRNHLHRIPSLDLPVGLEQDAPKGPKRAPIADKSKDRRCCNPTLPHHHSPSLSDSANNGHVALS